MHYNNILIYILLYTMYFKRTHDELKLMMRVHFLLITNCHQLLR